MVEINDVMVNASSRIVDDVNEMKQEMFRKMGREYVGMHEAWAVLRQKIEMAQKDMKTQEQIHKDMWAAIKEDEEAEAHALLRQFGNMSMNLCMEFAVIAAEARRAAEELN